MTTVEALANGRVVHAEQDGEKVWLTIETPGDGTDFTIVSLSRFNWDSLVAGVA